MPIYLYIYVFIYSYIYISPYLYVFISATALCARACRFLYHPLPWWRVHLGKKTREKTPQAPPGEPQCTRQTDQPRIHAGQNPIPGPTPDFVPRRRQLLPQATAVKNNTSSNSRSGVGLRRQECAQNLLKWSKKKIKKRSWNRLRQKLGV